jgi:hypothetical protein
LRSIRPSKRVATVALRAAKKTPLLLSAATGQGVKEALHALAQVIGEAPGRQG